MSAALSALCPLNLLLDLLLTVADRRDGSEVDY